MQNATAAVTNLLHKDCLCDTTMGGYRRLADNVATRFQRVDPDRLETGRHSVFASAVVTR